MQTGRHGCWPLLSLKVDDRLKWQAVPSTHSKKIDRRHAVTRVIMAVSVQLQEVAAVSARGGCQVVQ